MAGYIGAIIRGGGIGTPRRGGGQLSQHDERRHGTALGLRAGRTRQGGRWMKGREASDAER